MTTNNPLAQFRQAARRALDGSRDCGSCAQGAENCDYHMGVLEAAAVKLVNSVIGPDDRFSGPDDPTISSSKDQRFQNRNALRAAQRAALNKEDQDEPRD